MGGTGSSMVTLWNPNSEAGGDSYREKRFDSLSTEPLRSTADMKQGQGHGLEKAISLSPASAI